MLKGLAISLCLGAFLLGWPQVAPEQQTPRPNKHKEADPTDQPTPPASSVIKPFVSTPSANHESNNVQNGSPEKPLPRFLRPEWVIVYITAVYVLIAWWTLRAIKRQADSMETQVADARKASADSAKVASDTLGELSLQRGALDTQATHLASQLDEMQRQADVLEDQTKTARDRERARLSVYRIEAPLLAYNSTLIKPDIPMRILLYLVNDGNTMALNVNGRGHTTVGTLYDPQHLTPYIDDPEDWYPLEIPRTIRTVGTEQKIVVNLTYMVGVVDAEYEALSEATALALREGELSLTIGGEFNYEDIFGDEHKTPFWFLWVVRGNETTQTWRSSSEWLDLSGKST